MSVPPSLSRNPERNDADWIDHFKYLLSHHDGLCRTLGWRPNMKKLTGKR
jgi:hypothetical protein